MNISLPETLKSFVDEQLSQGGYGTRGEYVLLAGAATSSSGTADTAYFERKRTRVRKGAKAGSRR